MSYNVSTEDMRWTIQDDEQINGDVTRPCACPRQYSGLAALFVLGLLGALSLAIACGRSDRTNAPRPASEDGDIVEWALGEKTRVTHTGDSEVALMLLEANPAKPMTRKRTDARELAGCGEIDDILPSHPGTGEYFFVVDGGLQMGRLEKGARRTPIAIDPPIRINRLLSLHKSSPPSVLLVEEVSANADKQGTLLRLTVTRKNGDLRATASPAEDLRRDRARYERAFYNARCRQADKECLRIFPDAEGTILDIERKPKEQRSHYLLLPDFLALHRAMFHPDIPGAILLIASCGKK
jgi:hypothetical protein